jgi:heme a synthase
MTSATETKETRGAAIFAWATLAFLLLVILWGAFVRTSGSGGGCGANWPLCNGDFFPHHPRLATIIEFTHRSMTGICTALVAGMMAWAFYVTGSGHPARRAAVWSGVLLLTEALFGAVLVLRGYVEQNISTGRIVMQSVHFTNTLLLIAAVTLTAWFLTNRRAVLASDAKRLALASVVATIIVGANGSLAALADTLFPSTSLAAAMAADFAASSPLLVRMRWMHPAAALLGFVFVVLLVLKVRSRTSWIVMALLVLQIVLGIGDVLLLAPTWMQVLHLLGADLYWIALVVLWAQTREPA